MNQLTLADYQDSGVDDSSSTNVTEMATSVCSGCGEIFQQLAGHWRQSDCGYPAPTRRQREIVIGLLLGDGWINTSSDSHNSLTVEMITPEFLEWVAGELGSFVTDVRLNNTAREAYEKNCKHYHTPENLDESRYHDSYLLKSRCHPWFTALRGWYSSGQKRFPEHLTLTPLITSVWYCCDGSLLTPDAVARRVRASATFGVDNERDRGDYLVGLFDDVGFAARKSSSQVFFDVDDTRRLLEWMEGPLPGFEYKWKFDGY